MTACTSWVAAERPKKARNNHVVVFIGESFGKLSPTCRDQTPDLAAKFSTTAPYLWRCKHRRGLWRVIFGIPPFTPEVNVQGGCVSRKVRNSPKEILRLRVHHRRNAHCEALAAI